jgi:fido (protein-threonine AMPylation protein)
MAAVGYEFLRDQLNLSALPHWRIARVRPVTRVVEAEHELQVPAHVAPASNALLDHILFALKHEGVNLQILAQALAQVPATDVHRAVHDAPTSRYTRTIGYLWESLTNRRIEEDPPTAGNYVEIFDPEKYVTGIARRDTRWRVLFNGLGSVNYCATVRRTPILSSLIELGILQRTNDFLDSLGEPMNERALAWAYLHETEDSYAIEHEAPREDKARAFAALLRQAHEPRLLTEDYLVELQNAVVSNAFDHALQYREGQNWLRGDARGAAGVTYVPPPANLALELMDELLRFANEPPPDADSLVCAAIVSFGFVYIHPFMDGNGRLSRFLFHKALFQQGELTEGRLLPVSVAMKRNERDYLATLQLYSRHLRAQWTVRTIEEGQYDFQFNGHDSLYRYWDATAAAEFSLRMSQQALEVDLHQETRYLARYDAIKQAAEESFDVRNNTLATLIHSTLQNDGRVSNRRRSQFDGQVPTALFDLLERIAQRTAEQDDADATRDDHDGVE